MSHPSEKFTLAVVVPVWNDLEGLRRLLPQLLSISSIVQVVVVDDASDPPCNAETIEIGDFSSDERLTWLRSDERLGAGYARNFGLEVVDSSHVLYFDSDDIILPEFNELISDIADAETPKFDFCMFRHVDSRRRALGIEEPLASDQFHWNMIDVSSEARFITATDAARLCRVSAYPWNKIYNTEFLRSNHIKCTEIMVHNDVELHWTSFLRGSNVMASSRVCCEHFVSPQGTRLTNRSGEDRLQVFDALIKVHNALLSAPERMVAFADAALEFYLNLFQWIDGLLDEKLRQTFMSRARDFLLSNMTVAFVTLAASNDPDLVRRLNVFLSRSLT